MQRGSAFLVFVVLFVLGCSSTRTLPDVNYLKPYNKESHYLHPVSSIYHHDADSLTLFTKVDLSEFLSMRQGPERDFFWSIGFSVQIFNAQDSLLTEESWSDSLPITTRTDYLFEHAIRSPRQEDLFMTVQVSDFVRKVSAEQYLRYDKGTELRRESFLVTNRYGERVFGQVAVQGENYTIACATCSEKTLRVYHSNEKITLPPPPHGSNRRKMPSLENCSYSNIVNPQSFQVSFKDQWLFIGPINEADGGGVFLAPKAPDFPDVDTFKSMSEATRYITTRKEYERLTNTVDYHAALDAFWMNTAGGREKAKALIKLYYSRVEESNFYFSEFASGWMSDRGLIHIVFGNPERVYLKKTGESWVYGASNEPNSPIFRFQRKYNRVVGYYYELDRMSDYKPLWDRMVQAWKNGRIYTG